MKLTSSVNGVSYYPSTGNWKARTPGKRNLYIGLSQHDAEMSRLIWDARRSDIQPQAKPRAFKKIFNKAFNPFWPASPASYGLEMADEQ